MARNAQVQTYQPLRLLPIDLGVALVVLAALAAALLLRGQVVGRTTTFQSDLVPMTFAYPASYWPAETLDGVLLNVENPYAASPFKTALRVESRELDPASPPPLEELVNRRIDERSTLTGYHFLSAGPAEMPGAEASEIVYSYVVQPIDEPRRPSLPVVVQAREYVIKTGDRSYYFTLAAAESEFERASADMDRIMASVKL